MQAFGTKVGLSGDSSSPKRKPIKKIKENVVNVPADDKPIVGKPACKI